MTPRKFLMFSENGKPKKFFIFYKKELFYASGNRKPKNYIPGSEVTCKF